MSTVDLTLPSVVLIRGWSRFGHDMDRMILSHRRQLTIQVCFHELKHLI